MVRRFVALAMALSALFALPALVSATVSGGCSVIGTSTSGGSVDLTTNPVWHVRSTDQISLAASAPFVQTDGTASIYAFGAAIPVSSGHSEGETSYHTDSFDVATLSLLSRILVLGGAS